MAERRTGERPWTARVLTLFPEMFPGPLALSVSGRALGDGLWRLETADIRAHAADRHGNVDDAPFGGGPGMVLRADVVDAALAADALGDAPVVYLTPRGTPLDQRRVSTLAAGPGVTLLCGRYEGLDQRVLDARGIQEVSLGDFVLSGGEPAAFALIDACVRLLPGVVGDADSLRDESFAAGLLEHPQYTRPADWCGRRVPGILLSGHHARIKAWRLAEAESVTRRRRPDLWRRYLECAGKARESRHERH